MMTPSSGSLSRLVLSLAFAGAAALKAPSLFSSGPPPWSGALISTSPWLVDPLQHLMFVVVLIEITVAVALLFRRTAARAGQVAEVTLVLFTVFLVLLQHAGVAVSDCACFGSDVIVNAPEHYAINVSLLVIARRVQCMDVLGSEVRDSIRRGE